MDLAPDITPEDLDVFLQEADENLRLLDEDVIKLERDQSSPDLMQEIFRAAHTLKGSAGMLGYRQMAELAHAMEHVLDRLRKGSLELGTPVVDALLHSLDTLRDLRDELAESSGRDIDIAPSVSELQAVAGDEAEPTGPRPDGPDGSANATLELDATAEGRLAGLTNDGYRAIRVTAGLSSGVEWAAIRFFQVLAEVAEMGEVLASSPTQAQIEAGEVAESMTLLLMTRADDDAVRRRVEGVADVASVELTPFAQAAAAEPALAGTERKAAGQQQTVRIDVERLDELMNTISELVTDRTRISQIGKVLEVRYKGDDMVDALSRTSAHIVRVVDELQESTRRVRMQPIGTVFSGLPRLVRDVAQQMGKKVSFDVSGHETEIDRTVIERIRDPLVHLLRNSVDHGLESPEDRRRAGKSETGHITLDAYHEQGFIVISVEDDGGGIDHEKVKAAAVRRGLLSAEAASRLSDTEATSLIFMAGASTAEQTTQISGRGVGMDIVKANIDAINGIVAVDTKMGQGARFTLKLPLTLATLHALLVRVEGTTYAIPLVYVVESVRVEQNDISTVVGREVIRIRDSVIPLVRPAELLGLRAHGHELRSATAVVVVQFHSRLVGLAVDELMESQEIVVKPLGSFVGEVRGVAGASILGDGEVVLIVDVPSSVGAVIQRAARESAGLAPARPALSRAA